MSKIDKQTESKPKNKGGNPKWVKGVSGNPKGRKPKGFAISERIRARVKDKDWEAIIDKAIEMASGGDKYSRDFLLDRTEGKPTQPTADVSESWKEWLDGVFEETEQG